MKKIKYFIYFLALGLMLSSLGVMAAKDNSPSINVNNKEKKIDNSFPVVNNRIIVKKSTDMGNIDYKELGCKAVRELKNSIAMKCPSEIISLFDLKADPVYYLLDLAADIQINANQAWDQEILGEGVNVAILDTGIDFNHQELMSSYKGGYDFVANDNIPEDLHGHGTHVAGIIAGDGIVANAKGVAPDTNIYMYKVCGTDGCYNSDIEAAIQLVVDEKINNNIDFKVISMSLGGGNYSAENCDSLDLAIAVNNAVSEGIAVAVASGNDSFYVSSPACASGAISVGAVSKTGLMADFSNYGVGLDIVAPGVNIYSSYIDSPYAYMSGTSMATPHIAGALALLFQSNSDLTVAEAKEALFNTATEISADSVCYGVVKVTRKNYVIGVVPCTSDNYGAGIVDVFAAINYFTPPEPTIECNENVSCDDGNECTLDTCLNAGTVDSYCENLTSTDDITCSKGVCCAGICEVPLCINDLSCNDNENLTTDACLSAGSCSAICEFVWPTCNIVSDGYCPEGCSYKNDTDCVAPPVCGDNTDGICPEGCTNQDDDDCKAEPIFPYCGDGECDGILFLEDCRSCPIDCGKALAKGVCCGDGKCDTKKGEICSIDCE